MSVMSNIPGKPFTPTPLPKPPGTSNFVTKITNEFLNPRGLNPRARPVQQPPIGGFTGGPFRGPRFVTHSATTPQQLSQALTNQVYGTPTGSYTPNFDSNTQSLPNANPSPQQSMLNAQTAFFNQSQNTAQPQPGANLPTQNAPPVRTSGGKSYGTQPTQSSNITQQTQMTSNMLNPSQPQTLDTGSSSMNNQLPEQVNSFLSNILPELNRLYGYKG